jgi:hypothetical protein
MGIANVNFATPRLGFTALILAAKHNRPAIVSRLLQSGADRDARDHFRNTALVYASRHGFIDCVDYLLENRGAVNDGSLHEASRNLHHQIVFKLIQSGHDPNFASEMHLGRTALGELCFLGDGTQDEANLDSTFHALASGGTDPFRKSGSMLPIFLALSNGNPKPVLHSLVSRLLQTNIAHPALIFEQDQVAYSPTSYIKKLILPYMGHAARMNRPSSTAGDASLPYPEARNLEVEDSPAVSRAFHLSTTSVYTDLLNFLVRQGATDRFYYTGSDRVQPAEMVGATDDIIGRENVRRTRLMSLQTTLGQTHANPQALALFPGPRPGGNAGWNTQSIDASSGVQARVAAEKRQIEDRRYISELVNQHMVSQSELRKEAKALILQAKNKHRLDHETLHTEWMASRKARAIQLGVDPKQKDIELELLKLKESSTTKSLLTAREVALSEHRKSMDNVFTEEHKRIAMRPDGGNATLASIALDRASGKGLATIS